MRLNSGRLTGVILFVAFAVITIIDLAGFLPAFGDLNNYADTFGITEQSARTRLILQTVLSAGIIITALTTAYGLLRRATWSVQPARLLAVLFVIYGLYQVLAGFAILKANQTTASTSGALYVLIGVAIYSLVKRAVAPRPSSES